MSDILKRLAALVTVKTITTFVVVAVFAALALGGAIDAQAVIQIVTMVLAFYFGTQHTKNSAEIQNNGGRSGVISGDNGSDDRQT